MSLLPCQKCRTMSVTGFCSTECREAFEKQLEELSALRRDASWMLPAEPTDTETQWEVWPNDA